ncbi:ArsR/SmtB family transcription factor [Streptomyces sp. DSM 118148]|uniref:ArsR/SmtB family transcription factor n=1 Tax=Streptomyces sp. DSM 118148 TaxID=3448667 RepID=UPI00403FD74F
MRQEAEDRPPRRRPAAGSPASAPDPGKPRRPTTRASLRRPDPVRLRLFSKIASHPGGEACVCDIQDVGVSQSTVSHHLKKLREAGLLTSERRGTWVYYTVAPSVVAGMSAMLDLKR